MYESRYAQYEVRTLKHFFCDENKRILINNNNNSDKYYYCIN